MNSSILKKIVLEELKKALSEENKKHLVGTCVNSFDEDGECTNSVPYRDVSDFAVHEEEAEEITREEFLSKCEVPEKLRKLLKKDTTEFMVDTKGVYMLYDSNKDIHYFFI